MQSSSLTVIEVSAKEREAYDRFIQTMPRGSFRQGYAWGEVMSYDNDIYRLAVLREDCIAGTISIQKKRIPGTPISFFYAPRGPVIDFDDVAVLRTLLQGVGALASQHRAAFLRIDPDALDSEQPVRSRLKEAGFRYLEGKNWSLYNYPRILMRIDTRPDEADILKSFRKKHRQHINTLAVKDVSITEIDGEDGLSQFYELMRDLSIRKGFPLRRIDYYRRLINVYGSDIKLFLARHGGENLGGVMSICFGNKSWYLHGSSIDGRGNLHPNEALHWEVIKWAKERGAVFYDLGGTGTDYPPCEDNPNYNLYNFKKGFGAELHYLTGYYDLVYQGGLYRMFRYLEETALPRGMKLVSSLRRKYSHHE